MKQEKTYQFGMKKKELQEIFKVLIPIINEIRIPEAANNRQKEKKAA